VEDDDKIEKRECGRKIDRTRDGAIEMTCIDFRTLNEKDRRP